jgi:ribosomal protein S18 acetylase RimI-like enzyme
MITYTDSLEHITAEQLQGFFVGWTHPPSPETHLRLLHGSYKICLALNDEQVVGFINAISDGVMTAFIPNLEVLPDYQGQGIGSGLVRRMLDSLKYLYSIDLMADEDVQAFYERLGMRKSTGMLIRNYENQSGAAPK